MSVAGHADRAGPLRDYCVGLMTRCERKSVEPMAAVTAPGGRRRSINRSAFCRRGGMVGREGVGQGAGDGAAGDRACGPIEAWIIDDTGLPQEGTALGRGGAAILWAARQAGRTRQVAVSLSMANRHASLPVAYHLYLPQDWASDSHRRRKTGVPESLSGKIMLDRIAFSACT